MTGTIVDPYKLHATGIDKESKAAKSGKFRSILTIDSEPYQVGNDWNTPQEAKNALMIVTQGGCTFQIYDDQGNPKLDENGKII